MSSPMVEPIVTMLARWWAATQAGDDTGGPHHQPLAR
jgi:hypothetical protein